MQFKSVPAAADRVRTFAELAALVMFAALVTVFVKYGIPISNTVAYLVFGAFGCYQLTSTRHRIAGEHAQPKGVGGALAPI